MLIQIYLSFKLIFLSIINIKCINYYLKIFIIILHFYDILILIPIFFMNNFINKFLKIFFKFNMQ